MSSNLYRVLVGLGGYAIGYDIFEGSTYEGHTLIPFIEKISQKFNLNKPIVIADAGLLSKDNVKALASKGYEYILGARIKNETQAIKLQILSTSFSDGTTKSYFKTKETRLIVGYSSNRAQKDAYNRKRGLSRLEKQVNRGKLTKANINNKGFYKELERVLYQEKSSLSLKKAAELTHNM